MANTFFISDTHFQHKNILTFTTNDGKKLRDFPSIEEMDEFIVTNWNKVVRPQDKVYHLGDVAMSHKHLPILARLNGEKILIKGNHDTGKIEQYIPYFKDIRGSHQFDGKLLTHIPVHVSALNRWSHNIHGHLHSNVVMKEVYHICADDPPGYTETIPDTRYINVSVELLNYVPISYDELTKALA